MNKRVVIVLSSIAMILAVARLRSYYEPPDWDIGTYATIGQALRLGKHLYSDIWDCKPPAIYLTFAVAQSFIGEGPGHIYTLSVLAAVVTMLGVYRTASVTGYGAGMWAAGVWAAICFNPLMEANLPNTEVFINAAVVWAVALWLRFPSGKTDVKRALLIGALFAVASLYKQVAVAPAAGMAVAEIFFGGVSRGRAVQRVAIIASVGVVAWLGVYVFIAATDRYEIFMQTMFVYPRYYTGPLHVALLRSLSPTRWFTRQMLYAIPAGAIAIIGLLVVARSASRRTFMMLVGLVIGTHLAVALPGHFDAHYYQFWFVPIAVCAGIGGDAMSRLWRVRPVLARLVVVLAIAAAISPQLPWYRLTGEEWAHRKHGDWEQWSRDATRDAAALLAPGEIFYTWSDEAWMYWVARRPAPGTAVWKMHMLNGPLARQLTDRTLADLKRHPPEIVLHSDPIQPLDDPICMWLMENYVQLPGEGRRHWPVYTYIRKGGAVENRLSLPR